MRNALRLAFLAAVVASLSGCRFKGYESFSSVTTPMPEVYQTPKKGDPYGYGGVADATGGLDPKTRYGQGSNNAGTVRPGYDQPQKGSGNQPGEYPNVAAPGHAQTNAPAYQPSPSDIGG
jgi:hypothetical protein